MFVTSLPRDVINSCDVIKRSRDVMSVLAALLVDASEGMRTLREFAIYRKLTKCHTIAADADPDLRIRARLDACR